jgi:ABC-type thiamine transport system ATPase subunit
MCSLLAEQDEQLNQALLVVGHAQAEARDIRDQVMSIDDIVH